MIEIEPAPGILGVVVGCPGGCGGVFAVSVDAVHAEPATRGRLTATVQITGEAMLHAFGAHLAEHGHRDGPAGDCRAVKG